MERIVDITSKSNRIYTDILRLHQRKYRRREGCFLIEGENLVREAIRQKAEIRDLVVRSGSRFDTDTLPDRTGQRVYRFSEPLFDRAAATETSQGILAVLRKPSADIAELEQIDVPAGNLVVLDRLQDPGNIGTIIRTAEAVGYEAVLLVRGTADAYSPKAVRAAAGAILRMPVLEAGDARSMMDLVRKFDKKLAVTCLHDSVPYYDTDLSRAIALVIGNEGNGCDPYLIRQADLRVNIPMGGSLESLNASVAAGILMYETVRRRHDERTAAQ